MDKLVRVDMKKATFGRKWHMNWLRVLLIGSVILTVGGGCATTKRISINHSPAHTEAPIINPNKISRREPQFRRVDIYINRCKQQYCHQRSQ